MIEFMVIGPPRSGTTWSANWLTTDTTLCIHGPSGKIHRSLWDKIESKRTIGIADTVISRFYEWLNKHPARKVILHRSSKEVCESVGMQLVPDDVWCLDKVHGMHVDYLELFNNPKPIYEFLLQKEFDSERHIMLKSFQINTMSHKVKLDKNIFLQLMEDLKNA